MANPNAFDRDFGYLLPFLDKIAAAAGGLENPAAREELVRLVGDEKVRWQRIRELLQGAPGRSTPVSAASATVTPPLARASADGVNRVAPLVAGLTVGSLKPSR
ncbi:hypothetical protein POL68_39850 [Stigmatella sp. ncwal1]|uniref:Uncharacterized protein n=1 Tax=Stigmatella ashevillensis TaxID=2995309 RepID=A0ABT5DLY2_9BACT|nr:hypothetical protein [Stigmatella ashevillena]MDC0714671.1 hypothetical protein [Stigmatella ashevillena]